MKIGFLITARLKSTRLKLKILKKLKNYSVIEHIIKRAKEVVECDEIILCTSTNNQDLPLVRIAQKEGINYFNGSEEDVLDRLNQTCKLYGLDYAICITADNPLFSIYHSNLLSDYIRQNKDVDFITTTGMPIGVNIYAIKAKALETICEIKEEVDTEIWGALIHKDFFNIKEIEVEKEYKCNLVERLTLDEIDDYKLLKNIYANIDTEIIDILDVYDYLENNPKIAEINKSIQQKSLDEKIIKRIDKFYKKNKKHILEVKAKIYGK